MTTVAETILNQLGGKRFVAMTGASAFTHYPQGLRFKLPRNIVAKDGIQFVQISLMPGDTYTVVFSKLTRKLEHTIIHVDDGVYAENLRALFTARTGLEVSL